MFGLKPKPKLQTAVGTTIRILPQHTSETRDVGSSDLSATSSASTPESFVDAFVWLIILNVSPNNTANYLMATTEFDDGHFWLISDPERGIITFNAADLAAVAVSYVNVLLKMTFMRKSNFRVVPVGPTNEEPTIASGRPFIGNYLQQTSTFWMELTGYYGSYRKFWNVVFKFGDLIVQSVQLYHLLEAGLSVGLPYSYAALIGLSCLSQSFFLLQPAAHTAFTEVLVDTVFDMLFAIVCPIVLLAYSYSTFNIDRALARLYLKAYFPGSFQRQARMQSDPVSTTLFRFAFDSLRTLTWTNLVIRLTMNISFSYRLSRLVEVIHQRRSNLRSTSSKLETLKAQRAVPRWMGALFIAASVLVLVYTNKCISQSQKACTEYSQCVAFAYRWDHQNTCPCLAIVDVDRAPKTYEEWIHPLDVTETVKSLATSGDLQVLQLTNRQMVKWPEELHNCVNLQYLSLYYTDVEVIPDWFKVFHKLEFLSDLQGKFGGTNIVRMPSDAFVNMGSLAFMHLGYHPLLPQLPSFQGLQNLKSMPLAMLYTLTSMPELEPLVKLQRLELVSLNSLRTVPEVAANHHLTLLIVWQAPICCNGVLGDCNISHPVCSGMSASDCIPGNEHPSAESQAILTASPGVCNKNAPFIPTAQPPLKSQIDVCGGVLYRQCRDTLFDSVGMCVNSFFQVIACSSLDVFAINGRRQEILHGLGSPCDPKEELWLGCATKVL